MTPEYALRLVVAMVRFCDARFENATGEFCFGGLRYCLPSFHMTAHSWETFLPIIGIARIEDAIIAAGGTL